jgi:hypothetical protein
MMGEGMNGYLRNTENPNFIFYTPTAPLTRDRLKNILFSHTSHPCVLACTPGDESHRDVSAFMNQIFCVYIYSV